MYAVEYFVYLRTNETQLGSSLQSQDHIKTQRCLLHSRIHYLGLLKFKFYCILYKSLCDVKLLNTSTFTPPYLLN